MGTNTRLGSTVADKRGKTISPLLASIVLLGSFAAAQVNGVPASVGSIGFGGNFSRPPGVAASVTSIGPAGLVPNHTFITQNPFFPTQPNFKMFPPHHHDHHAHGNDNVVVYPVPYAVPYPVAVPAEVEPDAEEYSQDQYIGGPTIFDRRGPGQPAGYAAPETASSPAPANSPSAESNDDASVDTIPTELVFKDGHTVEVANYAIVGDTLYDMTEGHRRRVPLADLDLNATVQANDNRGVDFRVPVTSAAN
jgi:hypothetical protein